MQKEKFHIEYIFDKVSNHSLWNHLTTPRGLSSWFADDVNIHSQTYTFTWRKVQEQAVVIKLEPEVCIRFHWVDDEEASSYFEFIIHHRLRYAGRKGGRDRAVGHPSGRASSHVGHLTPRSHPIKKGRRFTLGTNRGEAPSFFACDT